MDSKITVLKSEKDIPKGAVRIHLYDPRNVLMPRGSMQKESIGLYLYEKLKDTHESWTNPVFGDNPTEEELLDTMYQNMMNEVHCAWEALLAEIGHEERDDTT